jgi:hypothetical protein
MRQREDDPEDRERYDPAPTLKEWLIRPGVERNDAVPTMNAADDAGREGKEESAKILCVDVGVQRKASTSESTYLAKVVAGIDDRNAIGSDSFSTRTNVKDFACSPELVDQASNELNPRNPT